MKPRVEVKVFQSGRFLVNEREMAIDKLDNLLAKMKTKNGEVWYYRESGQQEPPAIAMQILQIVVNQQLPITMSSKPDFSDFIDENGKSQPREVK